MKQRPSYKLPQINASPKALMMPVTQIRNFKGVIIYTALDMMLVSLHFNKFFRFDDVSDQTVEFFADFAFHDQRLPMICSLRLMIRSA